MNPLTLDSETNPTIVNLDEFPSDLDTGDQYTFEVTASDPSDATISAFYTITVTIYCLQAIEFANSDVLVEAGTE